MNNYINSPMLSTSFAENEKSASHSLRNFQSRKRKNKGLILLTLIVGVITITGSLAACDNSSIGIIGGSDGPTAIFTSDNFPKKLYDSKIKYIGDNSGVGNILSLVFSDDKEIKDFELITAEDAPKGIIVNLNGKSDSDPLHEARAITVLLLVQNCDYIKLSYEDKTVDYGKTEVEEKYDVKFSSIMKSLDSFSKFYRKLFQMSSALPLEHNLGNFIIERNSSGYLKSECQAEGHIILDVESSDAETTGNTLVYALVTYGEYGFQNGNFTKVSGSGVIPARITFDKDGNMTEYLEPRDGSEYEPSIKKMFPKSLWKRAFAGDKSDYEICKKQERAYAKKYLKSIGREAKIGEYADFEHELPEMDTEVSNKLLNMYGEYPYWIGTEEKIENDIRYVYEKQWDDDKKLVTFKKYEYDTDKVVEETIIDASNGKISYIKGTPRNEHYSKYN